MIDEKKLLRDITYSNKWNNVPCPEWVIKMIESQPQRTLRMISRHSTPKEEEIANDPVKMMDITTPKRLLSEMLGTMFDEEEVEHIANMPSEENKKEDGGGSNPTADISQPPHQHPHHCTSIAMHYGDYNTIERTGQWNMSDLIKRQDAINAFVKYAEKKTGYWIEEYDGFYYEYHCSECGQFALTKEETMHDQVCSKYCPNCGCRMKEVEHDNP